MNEELIARVRDKYVCTDSLHRELADAEFIAQSRAIVPALLSAVENVLKLCDDPYLVPFAGEEDKDGVLVEDVRKALTDALGGGE